jgi:hypothetical protein
MARSVSFRTWEIGGRFVLSGRLGVLNRKNGKWQTRPGVHILLEYEAHAQREHAATS